MLRTEDIKAITPADMDAVTAIIREDTKQSRYNHDGPVDVVQVVGDTPEERFEAARQLPIQHFLSYLVHAHPITQKVAEELGGLAMLLMGPQEAASNAISYGMFIGYQLALRQLAGKETNELERLFQLEAAPSEAPAKPKRTRKPKNAA